LDDLEKKKLSLEAQLCKAQKESDDAIRKLREVEQKCEQLQQNLQRYVSLYCVSGKYIKYVNATHYHPLVRHQGEQRFSGSPNEEIGQFLLPNFCYLNSLHIIVSEAPKSCFIDSADATLLADVDLFLDFYSFLSVHFLPSVKR